MARSRFLGRGLQDQDELQGSDNVVVISHALWRQHFAARDAAIGETLTLDGRPHVVVGVMPPGFQFPPESTGDIWTPLVPAGTPPTFRLSFYARLRDGVSPAAAPRGDRRYLRQRALDHAGESAAT